MGLVGFTIPGVPGVYRQAKQRVAELPRVRTDVAGFVGVGGPNRVGEAVRIDDWRSYELTFLRDALGHPIDPPEGATLAAAVRAFFANGGARCWIVNVAPEVGTYPAEELLARMLGYTRREGLEELLVHTDVALVAIPDLDAEIDQDDTGTALPPIAEQGTFVCCPAIRTAQHVELTRTAKQRLFTNEQLEFAQRYLIERCGRVKWRVFVVLAPPPGLTTSGAMRWRDTLTRNLADTDAAALYWPWLKVQDKPGDRVRLQSPVGHVLGAYAQRDLAAGPHVAPANISIVDAVGIEQPVSDDALAELYADGVNVLRGFPGRGVQIWGARTLAYDDGTANTLGWVNVRRCLSSIERNVERIGQAAVFEPNVGLLRLQVASAVTSHLLTLQDAGAMQGEEPDDSFYVRCDDTNNPQPVIDAGQLICEIGVAIAAPAEFIVFRVGRRDGVVELQELA